MESKDYLENEKMGSYLNDESGDGSKDENEEKNHSHE